MARPVEAYRSPRSTSRMLPGDDVARIRHPLRLQRSRRTLPALCTVTYVLYNHTAIVETRRAGGARATLYVTDYSVRSQCQDGTDHYIPGSNPSGFALSISLALLHRRSKYLNDNLIHI